jgi:hypothetical protein
MPKEPLGIGTYALPDPAFERTLRGALGLGVL